VQPEVATKQKRRIPVRSTGIREGVDFMAKCGVDLGI